MFCLFCLFISAESLSKGEKKKLLLCLPNMETESPDKKLFLNECVVCVHLYLYSIYIYIYINKTRHYQKPLGHLSFNSSTSGSFYTSRHHVNDHNGLYNLLQRLLHSSRYRTSTLQLTVGDGIFLMLADLHCHFFPLSKFIIAEPPHILIVEGACFPNRQGRRRCEVGKMRALPYRGKA